MDSSSTMLGARLMSSWFWRAGDPSVAPVEAEAVQAEEAAVPEPEMSPGVPDVLPPAKQPMVRLLPQLSSEEEAPEEVARPRTEAAADAPEDDMWAADADEEADDADAEAADLMEAARPDLEAEAAAAEAARSARQEAAAAAQALEEEESHLLPCERVWAPSCATTSKPLSLSVNGPNTTCGGHTSWCLIGIFSCGRMRCLSHYRTLCLKYV